MSALTGREEATEGQATQGTICVAGGDQREKVEAMVKDLREVA